MVTISHITHKLIDENILLQEAVTMGISNYTSLAKHLKSDVERIYGDKAKISSITRAIQRYAEQHKEHQKKFSFNFFTGIKLDSDVIYVVVHESSSLAEKIQRLFNEINRNNSNILNVIQGNKEIAIITKKEYKDLLMDILSDEKISHIIDDHDSLSLTYSKDYSFTPGLIYNISRNIAWKNINVLTWLHTPRELTLIVHENDATKCYNILHKMQKMNNKIK
jgi:aspartokinase